MSQNSFLSVKTKLCTKENFELLDYDSTNIIMNRININESGTLIRSKKDTFFIKNSETYKKSEIDLLKIIKDTQNDSYFINTGDYSYDINKLIQQEPAYIVYKNRYFQEDRNNRDKIYYKLTEGDIIKIGRVFIKILSINLGKKNIEEKKKSKSNFKNNSVIKNNRDINFTSLRKNSSYGSFYIHGQEVIKGSCSSGINYNNNEDDDEDNNDDIFVLNKNKLKKKLLFKKKVVLPRLSSSNAIFTSRIKNKIKLGKKKTLKLLGENNINVINAIKINNDNSKKRNCRICYGDEENIIENPLISPCLCKGSMKYIHYKCLKNWLESKIESSPYSSIELNDNIGMCYCTDNLICELCKTKFPDYINYNGKLLNLTFYRTKFKKYLIFESLQVENNDKKFIHILSYDNTDRIIIGRASECDISFPEISVSRHHCFIHYDQKKNNLYLEDNCSRFGTLILIQNPLLLMTNKLSLNIQKSKTFIKLKLNIPFTLFSCCSINNNLIKKFNSYQEQIEPFLDIYNTLVVKNNNTEEDTDECNDDDNDNDDNNDNDDDEVDKIYRKKPEKSHSIKLITFKNKKNEIKNNDNLFLLRLKNMNGLNKLNNFKKNKRKFKIKDLSINKDSSTKNQFSKDLIDTQKVLNSNKISINSAGGENPININRLNVNNHNLYIGNLNLFSLNTNKKNNKNKNKKEEDNKED